MSDPLCPEHTTQKLIMPKFIASHLSSRSSAELDDRLIFRTTIKPDL